MNNILLYFRENIGETVIFQWVEKIREILQTMKSKEQKTKVKSAPIDNSLDLSQVGTEYCGQFYGKLALGLTPSA